MAANGVRKMSPWWAAVRASIMVSACVLTGCAGTSTPSASVPVVAQDDGSEQLASPDTSATPPTLSDLESIVPSSGSPSAKEQARLQVIQQVALTYGLQGGLAHGTAQIDDQVRSQSDFLTRTYNFGALMIDGPYGTKILPPVIVESDHIYDQVGSTTVVIADHQYQILDAAAFAPIQPLWQTYLLTPWAAPSPPTDAVDFPDNAIEHKSWDDAVQKGYTLGEEQAFTVFKINLNRLNREYTGMIRWCRLVATGEATAPVVTAEMRPVVGGGDEVTIDEGKVEIVDDAKLLARQD